ncbi:MAG: Gfo/Idh/MocA family oxidoreductase [Actinomycetota bacterium]|nr:Gfo/Idh/MocA family oxidoreductase [Actinomycetota bacterium]
MLRVGLAGYGYWGPNLLRNFRSVEECSLVAVAEEHPVRAASAARLHPDLRIFDSTDDLLAWDGVDAVALALPAKLLPHYGLRALQEGKHVLLEKPMALALNEGRGMVEAAEHSGVTTMVDYTFLYSPAVQGMRSILASDGIGTPKYYQSTRLALGPFRADLDVVWDHVCHDIAIMDFLLGRRALIVHAAGQNGRGPTNDTVHMTVTYEGGFQLFVHASWLVPKKVRTGILAGDRGMVLFDDIEPDEKIRLYSIEGQWDPTKEKAVSPTYRVGGVYSPRLEAMEPLRAVAVNFVRSALGLEKPTSDWHLGLRVLAVLEAASEAVRTGRETQVESP